MHPKASIVLIGLALALAGCGSASQVFEKLPEEVGGLPADAPARPATDYQYPAVHDMPQARPVKPMSDADLVKLEGELKAAREKQEKAAAEAQTPVAPDVTPNTGNPRKP
jgi:hypothetical protein